MTSSFQTMIAHLHRGGDYGYYWTSSNKHSHWFTADALPTVPSNDDVYFNVNPLVCIPPTNSKGKVAKPCHVRGQLAHIAAMNTLFAEFDGTRSVEAIEAITPAPTVIIQSSPGKYHVYWFLRDTFTLNNASTRQRAKALQAAWVTYVESDIAAKDITRVLRVPGTFNKKEEYAPNYPLVDFVQTRFDNQYTIEELEAHCVNVCAPKAKKTVHKLDTALQNDDNVVLRAIDMYEVAYWQIEDNKKYLLNGLKKAIKACNTKDKHTTLYELLINKTVKTAKDISNSNWRSIIVNGIAMLGFRDVEIYVLADYLIQKYHFDTIDNKGLPHHTNDLMNMITKYVPRYTTSKYSLARRARYQIAPDKPIMPAATCAARTGRKPSATADVLKYYKTHIAAGNQVHATQQDVAESLNISVISVKRADKELTEQSKIKREIIRKGQGQSLSFVRVFSSIKTSPNDPILVVSSESAFAAVESQETQIDTLGVHVCDPSAPSTRPTQPACTPFTQTCADPLWLDTFGNVGVPPAPVAVEPMADVPFSIDLKNPDVPYEIDQVDQVDQVDQDEQQAIDGALSWLLEKQQQTSEQERLNVIYSHIEALTQSPAPRQQPATPRKELKRANIPVGKYTGANYRYASMGGD